jgi:hypothetical protein
MKILFFLSIVTLLLADVVPYDEDYYTKKVRNTELIYTEQNIPFASQAAKVEMLLQPMYEQKFGYVMDETLHVGLTSKYNQIANGFSTQYPNNRQINYIGGSIMVDYFSSTSWLNTLLYHESAHNYQVNAKDNIISSSLHYVLRNGAFFIPWFTLPNIVESSFLLEGNAVLNESWHGNGGRLYSGRFKAATLMQAKAGYLTPERVYNDNYFFLYGSHFYTLGGFYQKYLAEIYGLEKVNSYWREHSQDWYWPFFTNNSMQRAIGVDFETSFDSWRKSMEDEAKNLLLSDAEVIATSQYFSPINSDKDEIYFIINEDARQEPELIVYDKKRDKISKDAHGWLSGKVIKISEKNYTTQASANTSPWRIYQGLYDSDAFIIDSTKGKVIQGYLSDGRSVYFDVASSYDQPQLFIGSQFYDRVNSSVFIDGSDVYYFKQKDKTRTLYKNKKAIFSLEGYYSYMSGVDSFGALYFIANTRYGSGLFKYQNGEFKRVSKADTIIDARLIDDKTALVVCIGSDKFTYEKISLDEIDENPFQETLFVENEPYYRKADISIHESKTPKIDKENGYYSFLAMNYSGTNVALGNSDDAGFLYNVSINFADPLMQNTLSVFASRNADEYTLGGASYSNTQYFLQYLVSAYAVIDRPDDNLSISSSDERDFGLFVNARVPFFMAGHYYASLLGSYYQDYESNSRSPLSLSLKMLKAKQYGISMYPYSYYCIKPYFSTDRDDLAFGGDVELSHNIVGESYISLSAQYSQSDADNALDSRGVKITKSIIQQYSDSDPTTILMPSLKDTIYLKSVTKAGASLQSVFNLSAYFFTFPVSLRRESIFASYNYYALESFANTNETIDINEAQAGVTFDTLWFNKLPIPVSIVYIYNDNSDIADEESFRFSLGLTF